MRLIVKVEVLLMVCIAALLFGLVGWLVSIVVRVCIVLGALGAALVGSMARAMKSHPKRR